MKRAILVLGLVLVALAPVQARRPTGADFVPGEVLVQFRPEITADEQASLVRAVGGQALDAPAGLPPLRLRPVRVQVPVGQERAIAARLHADPGVQAAGLNYIVRAALVPNDALYSSQWNMPRINAPAAWEITTGSSDVVIAVVDTGLKATHPEFAGKVVPGYDLVNNDADPDDDHGHGTHVAGIALATGNNGIGMAGVSWGARVMPVKTLNAEGAGTLDQGIDGIIWAAYNGARIINLSWTVEIPPGDPSQNILQGAIDYAHLQGCLIVAAAGNQYLEGNPVLYPAACQHVIAVAATGQNDERAPYSEVQSYVDLAAPRGSALSQSEPPGHYILSTYPPAWYAYISGTSQAAPHVAGLAALVWSLNPSLSPDAVEGYIKAGAVNLGNPYQFGAGRIDAWAALQQTPHYLRLSPTQLTFLADDTVVLPPAGQVVNPASGSASWYVTGGAAWLSVSGPVGQTPSAITVTANPSGLAYGTYQTALLAHSRLPLSPNSPVVINVTLIYVPNLQRFYLPAVQRAYAPT